MASKHKRTSKTANRAAPIRVGRSSKPTRKRYPWDRLKVPGNYFFVRGDSDKIHASLRAQASKQGKARGVTYSVSQQEDGVKVRLEGLKLEGIEVNAG